MRALLLLVLATSAAAQTPGTVTARHPAGSSPVIRILVGATVSVGAPVLLAYAHADEAAIASAVAIPLTAALAVHYFGTDGSGSFGRTLVGAGLGSLSSVVLLAAGGIVSASGACGEFCFAPLVPAAVAFLIGPAIGAGLRYRGTPDMQPVVLVGPDGERTAGLALRVGL